MLSIKLTNLLCSCWDGYVHIEGEIFLLCTPGAMALGCHWKKVWIVPYRQLSGVRSSSSLGQKIDQSEVTNKVFRLQHKRSYVCIDRDSRWRGSKPNSWIVGASFGTYSNDHLTECESRADKNILFYVAGFNTRSIIPDPYFCKDLVTSQTNAFQFSGEEKIGWRWSQSEERTSRAA